MEKTPSEVSYSSVKGTINGKPVFKCVEEFWKLAKGSYINQKIFCKKCNLFNSQNTTFEIRSNRLWETRSFCENCASANIRHSNMLYAVTNGE